MAGVFPAASAISKMKSSTRILPIIIIAPHGAFCISHLLAEALMISCVIKTLKSFPSA